MTTVSRMGLALRRDGSSPADLYLDAQGNLAVVRDAEAVGQHARQRIMTHRGEWFLDVQAGVPWMQDIIGRGYDPVLAEALVKGEVVGTDGVVAVTSFSARFDRQTRGVRATDIVVTTEYDEEIRI